MTHILHLLGNRERIGGIIPVVEAIMEHTPAGRFQHDVIMHRDFPSNAFAFPDRIRGVPHIIDDGPSHVDMLLRALRCSCSKELRELLTPTTILHSETRGGLALGYLLHLRYQLPLVVTHQTYAQRKRLYRVFRGRKGVQYVLIAKEMQDYYGMTSAPNCRVISNPAAEHFGVITRSKSVLSSPTVRMVGTGTFEERKRWHLIPEAFRLLPKALRKVLVVHLYGYRHDGPYANQLHSKIKDQGLEEQILLFGPVRDVKPLLDDADWFLFPSYREPLGVSVIEALASGLPVIASNGGGPAELVVPGKGGYLFPEDDVPALAELLKQAAVGELIRPDSETISGTVKHRMAAEVAQQYAAVYESF